MAGGYLIDPATGGPAVRTASGALLPLPLTQDDLTAAGMPGPPGAPVAPPMGPDLRVAGPGGGPMAQWGNEIPVLPEPTPQEQQASQAAAMRAKLAAAGVGGPTTNEHASQPDGPSWITAGQNMPPGPAKVDPAELATQRQPASQSAQNAGPGGGGLDPMVQAVYEESLRGGGGGGGPRRLGVSGETHKFTTVENPGGDPALRAKSEEALNASDKYSEELAKSLNIRQQQAFEATQGEYAARAGQMAAAQQRFEAQQAMLQDYQAKRDAMVQEAAQMKTPQMEDYWKSRGTFANVLTGLSIALGGALQGLRGGQNPGLEMSNQSIERWIAEQKEAYNRAEGRVTDADNQFARMVQMFGSENLATEHLRDQAWHVRDGMLRDYAQKIGTPSALEAYNQAMLQTEAQRAELQARASQGAQVEIEQKLAMQGGGGGGAPTVLSALEKAARAKKALNTTSGDDQQPERAITEGTTDAIGGALDTVLAARGVKGRLQKLNVATDDTDDPRSGAFDYVTKNIPGTETRRTGQDLDLDTEQLARGAQQFLGKSDNDATLAEKQAKGIGGSGRERFQSADRLEKKAVSKIKLHVSGMTPQQRRAWLNSLTPDQRQIVTETLSSDARPAASEGGFQ